MAIKWRVDLNITPLEVVKETTYRIYFKDDIAGVNDEVKTEGVLYFDSEEIARSYLKAKLFREISNLKKQLELHESTQQRNNKRLEEIRNND